jgi:4-hydroxy-4-methyl-2-oxoglutarate aldolase
MNIKDKILDYLIKNKLSTTEVADAMGKTGVVKGVSPINKGDYKAGYVRLCFAWDNSNYNVHEQFKEIKEGEIVFICPYKFDDVAVLGEVMAKYALTYNRVKALVVLGKVRDASRLCKEEYPIWSEGFTPLGCNNTKESSELPGEFQKKMIEKFDRGIAVCDASGVVVIPSKCLDNDMLNRLHLIEIQEDIWNYSLNTLGWNTKEIIADKKYYKQESLFPKELSKHFSILKKGFSKKQI